ncbi:hypothetical protein DH2020_010286 [Rehmannia glutinosa]|uniref:Uncharacterized protein n=1 Tax=Rehmannia glutinosa TaxID=99300 RepID=A0ABR0X8R3_REHGL
MAKGSSRMLEDEKFFSRLLSKEKYNSSKQGEASFRVLYYGGATGSVPFTWESQPGTPKHKLNDNPPPPLTPPPYYQSSPRTNPLLQKKNSKNSKFFINSIFPRTPSKKISPQSSFSSSHSLPSTPINARKHDDTKVRSKSTAQFEDECEGGKYSPTSTLCFGPTKSGSPSSRRIKGYVYPIKSVKKVVLSIVGHGTGN